MRRHVSVAGRRTKVRVRVVDAGVDDADLDALAEQACGVQLVDASHLVRAVRVARGQVRIVLVREDVLAEHARAIERPNGAHGLDVRRVDEVRDVGRVREADGDAGEDVRVVLLVCDPGDAAAVQVLEEGGMGLCGDASAGRPLAESMWRGRTSTNCLPDSGLLSSTMTLPVREGRVCWR